MVDATSFEDVMMNVALAGSVHIKVMPYMLPINRTSFLMRPPGSHHGFRKLL